MYIYVLVKIYYGNMWGLVNVINGIMCKSSK